MKKMSYPRFLARAAMTLLAVFCFIGARAQETLTVYDGTDTNSHVPFYGLYADTQGAASECVIPSDLLEDMAGGEITAMTFYIQNPAAAAWTGTHQVYIGEVDATTLTGITGPSSFTVVKTASFDATGTELKVEFDEPYTYEGGNLLIGTYVSVEGNYKSASFYGVTQNENTGWQRTNGTASGSAEKFIPKTTFEYTPGSGSDCVKPTNLVATVIDAHSATLTWESETYAYNIEYKKASLPNDDDNWTSIEDIDRNEFTLTDLEQNTAYNARVRAVCDPEEGVYSGWKTVNFTTPVSCPAPTALAVALTPGDGSVATLSWTENGSATSWQICLNDDETNLIAADSNPFKLTKLTPETAYTAKVRAVGNDEYSSWTDNITFTPTNAYILFVNNGTATNEYVPFYGYYADAVQQNQMIYPASELTALVGKSITEMKFYIASKSGTKDIGNWIVSLGETEATSLSGLDNTTTLQEVYSGAMNFNSDETEMTVTFDNEYIYNGGNLLVEFNHPVAASYKHYFFYGENVTGASYCYGSQRNFLPKIAFAFGEPSACPKPTGLTVNYEGGKEATISWTSDATAWNLSVNGVETPVTQNPYTLTNLELGTTYEVKVQAVCSDTETSDWTNAVSFTTDDCMPEDMIAVNYTLSDSYGDGWNGNYILVVDENCNIVETLTIESGSSATGTVKVCGSIAQFMWYPGSYPGETSWSFTDAEGNVLFEGAGETSMQAYDLLYSIDKNPYSMPTDITVSEVGPHTATVAWTETGTATAWQIGFYNDEGEIDNIVDADSNPFTITGLDPETDYYVVVRAAGPNGESNWPCLGAEFTTDVATPAPTDLSATPLVTTAEVSWNGFAESYELEYTEGIYGSGGWLQYDDDSYATGVGNSSSNTWTWGVMYPGSMVTGTQLTKVSIYETAQYNTADITINIYSGGNDAPGTLLYTQTVTPEAADAFHEITLDSPVEITQGQNLWITLTEQGTYVLSACVSDEPNNNWVNNGGTWAHLGDLSSSLAGEGWMIRGEMASGNDPSTATWIAVENPSSPCTLEGLNPETTYTFRVRGDFGDEGMSDWAMSTFTTNAGTEDPIDLTAETTSTTATLDWTGYQESYNVQYREALEIDPTAPATIILEADDVWEDGSGYQMLLDADANTSGVLWDSSHKIYVDGEQYSGGDLPSSYYDEFEYIIPTNAADGSLEAPNSVVTGSVTITIPAGTYDFVILNPTPGDRFYIAAAAGDVETANDDFVFEAGKTYHFTMQRFGENDGAALEVTSPMGEWTVVENVTNPYELEGLTPDTYYEWQVQGILDEGTTNWVSGESFTTLPLIELANDDSNNEMKNSDIIANYDGETVDVTLAGRTLFKDGSWNTLCLPFDVELEGSPLEGATAKTLNSATMTGNHVSLTFGEAVTTLEAGVPYIIKWTTEGEDDIVNPEFKNVTIVDVAEDDRVVSPIDGVKFIGYYDAKPITAADQNIYYMTADNTLKYTGKARTLKACRAYFEFSEAVTAGGVREFTLNFGDSEATGIVSIDNEQLNNESGWYTVDGKKLDKQPKRKGVYINNGIKVVIK